MQFEMLYPGPFCLLKVKLEMGEGIKAESDAMVAMGANLDVEGKMEGGLFKALGRKLAGESFFFQTLTANRGPGEALLAHAIPGVIQPLVLDGKTTYLLHKDGFFASTKEIEVSTKTQNVMKGLFSGEGFFILKISGMGTLFMSSYGAIHPLDVKDGEEIIIDNSHLVAWPEEMHYQIQKASSGWFSSMTSGEGLVCRFRGPGRVFIQTRNPGGFGQWLNQFLPAK